MRPWRWNACANVSPAPDVNILSFTPFGPVLAVRPYCHNNDYWQVYFDTNLAIREVLAAIPNVCPTIHTGAWSW